jgi:hypothetical protein
LQERLSVAGSARACREKLEKARTCALRGAVFGTM